MTRAGAAACRCRQVAVILLVGNLAGCVDDQPFQRPDVWTATGSNAANLAVMAEAPADLARGRALESSDALAATTAVDRLRADHRRPLDATPTSGIAAGGAAGSGAAQN